MNIKDILNLFDNLTLLELNELIKSFEEKYNIGNILDKDLKNNKDNKVVKSSYSVFLNSIGINKISVIKIIRELNNLGLKESKDLVESAPVLIKSNIDLSIAEDIKKKLESAGAVIEIK